MGATTKIIRVGCPVLIAIALATLRPVAADAQCVGDCSGDGAVTVNELVTGVNIALGNRPASTCPAFQNASGMVDVSQLIRAVNFALRGCPAAGSPTPTGTVEATPTATAIVSPSPSGPIGSHRCTLLPGNSASHLEVDRSGFPVPIFVPLSGTIDISCGATGGDGRAGCRCTAGAFAPITITGLGKLCITPSNAPCPEQPITCGGGGIPLGLLVGGDGNIGTCNDNAECAASCDTACAGSGAERVDSGCTGFCSAGSMHTCNRNADCAAGEGVCNGADPVGARSKRCQCTCLNRAAGSPPRPGELQCDLAWTLSVVDAAADCTAAPMFSAPVCTSLTTSTAAAVMTDVNYGTGSIPASDMVSNQGAALTCDVLRQDQLTGLKLRGAFTAFGATPAGDALNEVFVDCQ